MKKLNIKLIFPYNWYHFRNVKVYDDKKNLVTKISHCEHQNLIVDGNSKSLTLKLDFFKSSIPIPEDCDELHLAIFLNFRDRFPDKYFDVLKRRCLTGKLLTKDEFKNFDLSFYNTHHKWILKSQLDHHNLILGLLISGCLLVLSILEQKNEFQDLIFFISLSSLTSIIMIFAKKNKLLLFDYRSRMIATGFAFFLGTLFLNSPFYIVSLLLIFSSLFLLKSFRKIG